LSYQLSAVSGQPEESELEIYPSAATRFGACLWLTAES
jgi:hypothetical protein